MLDILDNTVIFEIANIMIRNVSNVIFFFLLLFLPVTWMTVRSLKFQKTASTREQSRSGLNALSC